ncbi:MAG: Crp/Fnr family transcriptional regulator [Bacteroidetes bacterium]|nr:Crp/Fnr family transcriptional regulator [Bacteroidota bacterium]
MDDIFLQQFISTLQKYYPVADNTARFVFEKSSIKTFLRNDIVAKAGKTDSLEYFLLSGIFHAYSVSPDNEQVTTRIFLPQTVITPHIVRTFEGRSIQFLACLQDAVAVVISMSEFNAYMQQYSDLHAFGYKVVESELRQKAQREVSLLTLTAKERLLLFRKEYPNLENIIPHTTISGFLGITPVSFSRLRNELASPGA